MFHSICSSNIHLVSVAGLPLKLTPTLHNIVTPEKEKRKEPDATGSEEEPNGKKQRTQKEHPWHPKLKVCLTEPLKVAKSPGIGQIKAYCGLAADDPILPNTSATDCRHYLLVGCCRYGTSCKFKHGTASGKQAKVAIPKLEKFIKAPEGLRGK